MLPKMVPPIVMTLSHPLAAGCWSKGTTSGTSPACAPETMFHQSLEVKRS